MQSSLDGKLEERLLTTGDEFEEAGMAPLDIALEFTMATATVLRGRQYKRIHDLLMEVREAIRETKEIEAAALQRDGNVGHLEAQAA